MTRFRVHPINLQIKKLEPTSIVHSAGVYYIGRGISAATGFLIIPLMLRGLGIADYGAYSLWLVVCRWGASLCAGWLQQSILRYTSVYDRDAGALEFSRTVTLASVYSSAFCGGAVFLLVFVSTNHDASVSLAIGTFAVASVLYTLYFSMAQANFRPKAVILGDNVSNIFVVLTVILCIGLNVLNLANAFLIMAGGWLLGAFVFYLGIPHHPSHSSASNGAPFSWVILRKLLAYGLPMGMWFTLAAAQHVVVRLAVSATRTAGELGEITAILDFMTKVATVVFTPILLTVHPSVMRLWAENRFSETFQTIKRSLQVTLTIGVVLISAVVLFNPVLNAIIFGNGTNELHHVGLLTLGVSVAAVLAQVYLVAHKGLEVTDATPLMAQMMLFSLIINLVISIMLAGPLGVYGPVFGIICAYAVYMVTVYIAGSRRVRKVIEGKLN